MMEICDLCGKREVTTRDDAGDDFLQGMFI